MPKIFRAGDFHVTDEVFTISDDDFLTGGPLPVLDLPEEGKPTVREAAFSEDFGGDDGEQEFQETDGSGRPVHGELGSDGDVIPLVVRKERERILQQARADAEEIVNRAKVQTEMEHERFLEETARDVAVIKKRAYEEAYSEGMRKGVAQQIGEIADCVRQLQMNLTRMAGEQAGFMAEYEHNLKWLALDIGSKVLAKRIEQDDRELVELVCAALQNVKSASWVSIELSDQTLGLLEALQAKVGSLREGPTELKAVGAPAGTVILETPDKLLDASVSKQLENLKKFLQQMT